MPITLGVDQWMRLAAVLGGATKIRMAGNDTEVTFADFCTEAEKLNLLSHKD